MLPLNLTQSTFAAAPLCGLNIDPTNPTGYPSPDSIRGVDWVRVEFKDCSTDNSLDGSLLAQSIQNYQSVVQTYNSAGIGVLIIVDYLTYPDARNNITEFAERSGIIAGNISGNVAYQVWNEPDIWLGGNMSPAEYASILQPTAAAIKAAGGKVISGSSASGQPFWVESVANIMGGAWDATVDGNGVHLYGKQPAPTCALGHTGDLSASITGYHIAGKGKPLWITEIGMNTTDQQTQAEYLTCFYSHVRSRHLSQVENILWFAWSDGMVNPMGITDANNQPKSSYSSYFSINGCTNSSNTPSIISSMPTIPFLIEDGQGCTAGGTSAVEACVLSEWPVTGPNVPIHTIACACQGSCQPFEDQITFDRPTNQDYGQKDGTGQGLYQYYDHDIQDVVEVLPIMGLTSDGTFDGGPIITPPPVGNCLACPVNSSVLTSVHCEVQTPTSQHHGLDYGVSPGTPVFATTSGRLDFIGFGFNGGSPSGYGYQILIIDNEGRRHFYGHLDWNNSHSQALADQMSQGTVTVNPGQQIGAVGSLCMPAGGIDGYCYPNSSCTSGCANGNTTGPHLHYEIRSGPQYDQANCNLDQLDPQTVLPASCGGFCAGTPPPSSNCTNGTSPINCNPDAQIDPSKPNNVKPVNELIASVRNTGYAAQTDFEHIQMCYNDVIRSAQDRGMDPAMTMAMWIEESGASNYCKFPGVADFGCAASGFPREDFKAQIACFRNLQNAYATGVYHQPCRDSRCEEGTMDVLKFLQTFSGASQACVNNNFGPNPHFNQQIHDFYRVVRRDGATLNDSCILPSSDWGPGCLVEASCP